MQLSYRGIPYQSQPFAADGLESEVIGTYRGAQFKRSRFNLPPRTADGLELKFLGHRYHR
jgi:hypothetical protein